MKKNFNHPSIFVGFLTIFLSFLAVTVMCTPASAIILPPIGNSLGDFVWNDLNHNGIQDAGEPGLADITVHLLNSSQTLIATGTTNAGGNYLFSGLAPGDFYVQFDRPAGFIFTIQNQGGNPALDSNPDPTGLTGVISFPSGTISSNLTIDAGMYAPVPVPGTLLLLGTGLVTLTGWKRFRKS